MSSRPRSLAPHAAHVREHVERLMHWEGATVADEVLRKCGLKRVDGRIVSSTGGELKDTDCVGYVRAVGAVMGEAASVFLRANFALAGCTCHRVR